MLHGDRTQPLACPPGTQGSGGAPPGRGIGVEEEEMIDSLPDLPGEPHIRSFPEPPRAVGVAFDVNLPPAFMEWLQRSLNRDEEPTKKFFEEVANALRAQGEAMQGMRDFLNGMLPLLQTHESWAPSLHDMARNIRNLMAQVKALEGAMGNGSNAHTDLGNKLSDLRRALNEYRGENYALVTRFG